MSRVKKFYYLVCNAEPELGTFSPGKVYEATSSGIRFSIEDDNGKQIPMRNDISSTAHVWDYFEEVTDLDQFTSTSKKVNKSPQQMAI